MTHRGPKTDVTPPSPCTAVSYLFTYLLLGGYPVSYPVGYLGNELPDNRSPNIMFTSKVSK